MTTRVRRPLAVGLALVALLAATALVLKLRGNDPWAAKVDGTPIPQKQIDRLAAYGADEARIAGRGVLKPGTPAYRQLERQAIDLLVYHEELRRSAAHLGIRVTAADVEARLGPASAGGDSEEASGLLAGGAPARRAFAEESIRGELLYRKIYDSVTRNVAVSEGEIRAYSRGHPNEAKAAVGRSMRETKRNAVMARWVARMKRDYAVKIEYAPRFRKP